MGCLLMFYQLLCLLFFCLSSQPTLSSSSFAPSATPLCSHNEASAVMKFKSSFSINKTASGECKDTSTPSYTKTDSWKEGTDCCSWDGVTCDNKTGQVIGLDLSCSWLYGAVPSNSSLFHLPHLQKLNLAHNHFNHSKMSSEFAQFKSLKLLNLTESVFAGQIPLQISHLSKLVSLDLSWNDYQTLDKRILGGLVQNLTEVRQLFLDGINMSSINPNVFMNTSSSLNSLSLEDCDLQGQFPENIFHLPNLKLLNLKGNWELNIYLPKFNQSNHLELLNLSLTNLSGALPNYIGNLVSLKDLDLHSTSLSGALPNSIGNLVSLKDLDLSGMSLSGALPNSIGNLVSLETLALRFTSLSRALPNSIFNLVSLKVLDLSDTSLSGPLPNSIGNLVSLETLALRFTSLSGALPNSIGNLVSLKVLDLSDTSLSGTLPNSIGNLVSLKVLDLSDTSLSGTLPNSIGNLVSLKDLDLSYTSLTGALPNSIGNLVSLIDLDLSYTSLSGALPNSIGNLVSLKYLDLSYTSLSGALPNSIGNLVSLETLTLSFTNLSRALPNPISNLRSLKDLSLSGAPLCAGSLNSIGNLISLESLDLKACNFSRIISRSLGNLSQLNHSSLSRNNLSGISQLVNLTWLDLSSNNLSGIVESDPFSNLQNQQYLDHSYNNLYFNSNHTSIDYTLPNLRFLYLSSCNVNQFPQFLKGLKALLSLDLSNNGIYGKIPKWMWDVGKDNLEYLNLSHNLITEVELLPWKNIIVLDFSSNLIQGDLPILPMTTSIFLISNNNMSGEISDLICNVSYLEVLDMSHNKLSGIIPQCFGNLSTSLHMLNLGTNKLHGTIPSTFANGCQLENLNLNANQLEGPLTQSIINCRSLQVLDLGNNKINATFPHWLGNLQELRVLVLKSNQMHGSLNGTRPTHSFPMLQIFDLSNNNFIGQLPTGYIENFKTMMNVEENRDDMPYIGGSGKTWNYFYSYSVHLIEKGQEVELMKIFATLTIINLSNNKFEGEIPRVIGNLSSLIGLNLSHNYLIGHIPPSLGNLINLEWLDLSSSKLDGKIPEQLLNLTMLSSLNLSKNELVGHIPEGKQFNTFENSSYEGNDGLCDFPLSRDCSSNEAQQPPPSKLQEEDGSKSEIRFGWKVVLIGYMSGFMFGVGMGYAVFWTGKPKWIVSLVEAKHHRRPKKSNKNARTSRTRS